MKIKITVATVTWNPGALLATTLTSVAQQDYPLVEHIIVDGNSTDDTLPLLHRYQEANTLQPTPHEIQILSEPDRGLYDAMNKAIGMATGHYILFLNAGDKFHSPTVLTDIAARTASAVPTTTDNDDPSVFLPAVVYGNTNIVDREGKFMHRRRLQPPANLTWQSFRRGMLVCHQAFFAQTALARQNLYNLNYRFSADFDWCIRIMREADRRNLALINADIIVADYLNEGMTTHNHRKSLLERLRIMARHYGWARTIAQHICFVFRSLKNNV